MVQGVYMPFDPEHRASIYRAVTTVCNKYEHNVVLGDFNAVMYTTDRSSHQLYPKDNQHKQAMTEGELRPTDRSARPYTFTNCKATDSSEAEGAQSRIDDILIGTTICDPEVTGTPQATDDSDHLPLMTTLDLGGIVLVPLEQTKTEAQPSAARFTLSMKKEQLLMYQSKLHVHLGQQIYTLRGKVESSIAILDGLPGCQETAFSVSAHNALHTERLQAAKDHGFDGQVQEIAQELEDVWQVALETARQTCDQSQPRPCKRYLCRGDKRKLMDLISQGKQARSEYESCQDGTQTKEGLHNRLRQLRQEGKDLTKVIRREEAKSRKERFQILYSQKKKLANAIINNKKGERIELNTLRHPSTEELLYKKEDVLAETQRYFEDLNKPPAGIKTQDYLPQDAPLGYPWAQADALDGFQLEIHVGRDAYKFINLDDHIRDQTAFQQCLKNTKLGKSLGPDAITNELLRYPAISTAGHPT